jgi:hypothetical protein
MITYGKGKVLYVEASEAMLNHFSYFFYAIKSCDQPCS